MKCSFCRKEIRISARTRVEIDACPHCGSVWHEPHPDITRRSEWRRLEADPRAWQFRVRRADRSQFVREAQNPS